MFIAFGGRGASAAAGGDRHGPSFIIVVFYASPKKEFSGLFIMFA
jgi:hypothetical protein